jgi:hypothetical protein
LVEEQSLLLGGFKYLSCLDMFRWSSVLGGLFSTPSTFVAFCIFCIDSQLDSDEGWSFTRDPRTFGKPSRNRT